MTFVHGRLQSLIVHLTLGCHILGWPLIGSRGTYVQRIYLKIQKMYRKTRKDNGPDKDRDLDMNMDIYIAHVPVLFHLVSCPCLSLSPCQCLCLCTCTSTCSGSRSCSCVICSLTYVTCTQQHSIIQGHLDKVFVTDQNLVDNLQTKNPC
jgi:hypothetical protein